MKILHVDHSPVFGGAERSVLELAAAQLRRGDDVTVAVGRPGAFSEALSAAGVPWLDLNLPESFVQMTATSRLGAVVALVPAFAQAAWRMRRGTLRQQPDVIQVHTRKAHLVSSVAFFGTSVPLVWHMRDDVPPRALARFIFRIGLRRVNHVVVLTDWLADNYRAARLLPRSGRVGIVPSGVDGRALGALPTPWLDGQRGPVIGFVGQIAAWKGVDMVVDAFDLLDGPADRCLTIAGDVWFPAAERGYDEALETRIARSRNRDRIKRLHGASPAEAFAAIDLLVHASLRPEPFGRVLVEALAARRPVVALPRGAAPEILAGGVGVLADSADATGLARGIEKLLADPAAAARMVEAGLARAAQFAPDAVAEKMAHEYEALR
jgi:glycosyltransferase involved in cell wall biosynthesis